MSKTMILVIILLRQLIRYLIVFCSLKGVKNFVNLIDVRIRLFVRISPAFFARLNIANVVDVIGIAFTVPIMGIGYYAPNIFIFSHHRSPYSIKTSMPSANPAIAPPRISRAISLNLLGFFSHAYSLSGSCKCLKSLIVNPSL